MPAGFSEIKLVVPKSLTTPFRINQADFSNNQIAFDASFVAGIEADLAHHLCMIVGAPNRGKTFVSKLIGLRFLQSGAGNPRTVYWGNIERLNVAETIESFKNNNSHTKDRFLYLVEDCHINPAKALDIIESLSTYHVGTATILFTSRKLQTLVRRFSEAHKVFYIKPDRELVNKLIELHGAGIDDQNRAAALDKLMSIAGAVPDLKIVGEIIQFANTKGVPLAEIEEVDLLRAVIDERLSEASSRSTLLHIASIAQFDIAVAAAFVETKPHDILDSLVNKGMIARNTIESLSGLFYELEEEAQAEVFLRAAAAHGLLDGQEREDFTINKIVEYILSGASNFIATMTGLLTAYGDKALRRLIVRPDAQAAIIKLMSRSDFLTLHTFVQLCVKVDRDSTRAILRASMECLDEKTFRRKFEALPLWTAISLMVLLKDILPDLAGRHEPLFVSAIANGLSQVKSPGSFSKNIGELAKKSPKTLKAMLVGGALSASNVAKSLTKARTQRVYWTIKWFNQVLSPTLQEPKAPDQDTASALKFRRSFIRSVLEELGGVDWLAAALEGQSVKIVAKMLEFTKKTDEMMHAAVVARIDRGKLLTEVRVDNAWGLVQVLAVLPRVDRLYLLQGLSDRDIQDIAERSTLAGLISLLDKLKKSRFDSTGKVFAGFAASQATMEVLSKLRLGLYGRVLVTTAALCSDAALKLCATIAGIGAQQFIGSFLLEAPGQRFTSLSLLMMTMRKLDRVAACEFAEMASSTPTAVHVDEESVDGLSYVLYNFAMCDARLGAHWLLLNPSPGALDALLRRSDLEVAKWTIWNTFRVEQKVGVDLLSRFRNSESFEGLYGKGDFDTRVSFDGLAYIISGAGPKVPCAVPAAVVHRLNETAEPEKYMLLLIGALCNAQRKDREGLMSYLDRKKLGTVFSSVDGWKMSAPEGHRKMVGSIFELYPGLTPS